MHDQEHLGQPPFRGVVPRVSVVILTHNEEANIASCLRSCAWSDDVHVIDSGSTDRTVEIARSMGAIVHEHAFESFAAQRNWAIDHAGCTHRWQFHLDADERFTQGLVEEMARVLQERAQGKGRAIGAFRVASKTIFMDKWIRRSGGYPAYQVRMIRVGKCRFINFGHGQRELCEGQVGTLNEPYVHYAFSKGLAAWFDKHNQYSTREAEEAVASLRRGRPGLRQLFARDATARRRALKTFSYGLKFRALWRFLYSFGWRGGWLDGLAGLRYCLMVAMYEFWTELKIVEQRSRWQEATDALTQRLMSRGEDDVNLADVGTDRKIDVFVPTLNEAGHIHQTVINAQQVGPVYVLDSISNDGTQRIARQAGATVVEHRFEGYARQKNWGLTNLPMNGEWVFILDADERITPALRAELSRVVWSDSLARGFFVNRQMIFMGQAIRFGGLYPSWNLRFFKRGSCWYEDRRVHEHMICDGPTAYLKHPMLHVRRETLWQYIQKHVKYADLESDEWVRRATGTAGLSATTAMTTSASSASPDGESSPMMQGEAAAASSLFRGVLRLRQWLRREVWPSVPMRPLVRFVWMYFVRLGVLDGRAGWNLALLMASYEFMITLLYQEKLRRFGRDSVEVKLTREFSKERAA